MMFKISVRVHHFIRAHQGRISDKKGFKKRILEIFSFVSKVSVGDEEEEEKVEEEVVIRKVTQKK